MNKKVIKKKFHLLPPATDKCQICAVKHEPDQPHDQQSLFYRTHFHMKHKRFPCWSDAIAHCAPEIKKLWKQELSKKGVWAETD